MANGIELVTKTSPDGQQFRICSMDHGYSIETLEGGGWIICCTGLTWEQANLELDMMAGDDIDFNEYHDRMSSF